MNIIRRFEKQAGGRWAGITFHQGTIPVGRRAEQPMNFCEAIKASRTGPITLTEESMRCPGALRSFGWSTDEDDLLAVKMAEMGGFTKKVTKKLIKGVPRIDDPIAAITIGDYDSPDVMVSYAQPESAMRLIYAWQRLTGSTVDVILSSVMAACGWVVAGTHVNQTMSLSFGCPESRRMSAIGNDRLIVGLPSNFAEKLCS